MRPFPHLHVFIWKVETTGSYGKKRSCYLQAGRLNLFFFAKQTCYIQEYTKQSHKMGLVDGKGRKDNRVRTDAMHLSCSLLGLVKDIR